MKKMYIAVLDEAPDYMVPTLVAHSILNAHVKFDHVHHGHELPSVVIYRKWFSESFRKVVLRVNRKEYDKIKATLTHHEGHENTICNGEGSCLVVLPVESDAVPNVLKFAKLWAPFESSPTKPTKPKEPAIRRVINERVINSSECSPQGELKCHS